MNRRDLLKTLSCGFGYLALAGLTAEALPSETPNSLGPRLPHFAPKAKRVIFLYMQGGPSQHETFDFNPELAVAAKSGSVMNAMCEFNRCGQSGLPVSELLPQLGKHADELCVLNGMHTDSPSHPEATVQLHTGSINFVRPSMGAWVVYGLGSENQNLPGFIAITGAWPAPAGVVSAQNYGSAFLPATYQGTVCDAATGGLPNIANPELTADAQRRQIDLIQSLNKTYLGQATTDPEIEGLIQSYEMAFRMQTSVPGVLDIQSETEKTKTRYGLDNPDTRDFGTQCLLARRLAEAGVRFIEVSHGNWDHHKELLPRIRKATHEIDQPIAALLEDLKQRGLLKDTLVVWGGEFGRTTKGQNGDGRNHNNLGYTMWMAGGGVQSGMRYGATEAAGGSAISGKIHLHDLHATILHQLGLDHTKLTYRHGGRDFRLTDVHGNVVKEILA